MIDSGYGVELRGIVPSDTDKFFEWRNDKKVWKWCRQNSPLSEASHKMYWSKIGADRFFGIYKDGEAVGCTGLTSIDYVNSRAEFSLYIGPEHQGQRLGEKALKTLVTWAFEYLNMNSIWGESFDGNPALKVFDKIGMKRDGVRRDFYFREGKYIDAHLISIKRDEWEQLKSSW